MTTDWCYHREIDFLLHPPTVVRRGLFSGRVVLIQSHLIKLNAVDLQHFVYRASAVGLVK